MRAITLEEIAEATKIGTRSLKALEDEHFEILPGGIFNKGFVRAYAKYLGLNEEQAVADYMNAIGEQAVKPAEPRLEEIAAQAETARNREALNGLKEKGSGGAWIALVLFILLIGGGSAGWKYYQHRLQVREEARAAAQAQAEAEAQARAQQEAAAKAAAEQAAAAQVDPNAPVGDPNSAAQQGSTLPGATAPSATPPAAATNVASRAPIELQIKVSKPTWVSIQTDGKAPSTETLKDSEVKSIQAQQKVVLTTGNALQITCNGKSLGTIGEDNKRSVLRFTPECVLR